MYVVIGLVLFIIALMTYSLARVTNDEEDDD